LVRKSPRQKIKKNGFVAIHCSPVSKSAMLIVEDSIKGKAQTRNIMHMASASLPVDFSRGMVTNVHQGDCQVSGEAGVTLSTVLGSCISACVRDKSAGLGGMNHFLLATQSGSSKDRFGESARYGAFAMEQLINMVLSKGSGRKANLEFKIFGGGNIHAGMNDVGQKNIEFVREFLRNENYVISSEDLGGSFARRVMFQPATGRALVKRLDSRDSAHLVRDELAIAKRQIIKPVSDDIELF
jgi:chemotaxis protein CheD